MTWHNWAACLLGAGLVAGAAVQAGAVPVPAQPAPLRLTILIDVSYTMDPRPPRWSTDTFVNGLSVENIGRGLARLFDLLGPADTVRLATFAGPPVWLTPFTADRTTLDRAVERFQGLTHEERFGPSPIWDAVVAVAEAPPVGLDRGSSEHLILLISDGRGSANRLSLAEAIDRLVALRVRVSAVGIPALGEFTDGTRTYRVDGADVLKRITSATGGLHVQYSPPENHAFPLFERLIRFFRDQAPEGHGRR